MYSSHRTDHNVTLITYRYFIYNYYVWYEYYQYYYLLPIHNHPAKLSLGRFRAKSSGFSDSILNILRCPSCLNLSIILSVFPLKPRQQSPIPLSFTVRSHLSFQTVLEQPVLLPEPFKDSGTKAAMNARDQLLIITNPALHLHAEASRASADHHGNKARF